MAAAPPAPGDARSVVAAAIAAVALALALAWPAPLHLGTWAIGHPGNDSWNHVWGYWWVAEELGAGRWPAHTDLLMHPRGGTLYFIDTMQALVSLPLQWLGGPVLAFNAVMLLGIAGAGFAAWLLTWRLTGDAAAAVVALVVYEAAPHHLGQAYNGISETVGAGWLPLTLWCVLRVLDRPSWGRAVALGLSGAACMLTGFYFGLFAALGSAVVVAWVAMRQPWAHDWRRVVARLTGAVAIAAAFVVPVLMVFRASLDAPDALVTRDPAFVEQSLLRHNITDLVAFFLPTKVPSPDLEALYGEQLIIVIYLGWVATALAVYAVVATRRRRELAPWLVLAAVFFVFSLGPYLNIGGQTVLVDGRPVPLPFLPLYEAFPVFDRISHPFRFVTGVSLVLGIVASHGLRHLARRWSPGRRLALAGAVGALVVAEVALASPARIPLPAGDATVPEAYEAMARDPVPGAVLDLPMTVPNLERAVYVWYQSAHGRPVPWGLNDPMPADLLANRLTATLIRIEATRARTAPPELPVLDLVVGTRTLARLGYRYVVVHQDLYPDFKRAQVEAVLRGVLGEPERHPDDALLVYRLPELTGVAAAP